MNRNNKEQNQNLPAIAPSGQLQRRPRPKRHYAPAKRNAPSREHHRRHERRQPPAHKLVNTLSTLVAASIKGFILWAVLSTAAFAAGAYFIFNAALTNADYPLWYNIILGVLLFGAYAFFGLIFGILMAFLHTIKAFAANVGGLVREAIGRVKNSMESKIDNIADTFSHSDVAQIVKQTFNDLSANIRQHAAKTMAGVITIAVLTGLIYAARKILLKSVGRIKNKAEFFALLSTRVTLLLAVILNLKDFAKAAIWLGYFAALTAFMSQGLLYLLVK
ncbi:MAG: hypothetical protein LBR90_00620 [Elusimicrobiota bacterium]|jgi:ABC-type multidrug transport system fused ATPase/permease subunit|nr:hypothetical protein [Elusimicrobiota bacterium]